MWRRILVILAARNREFYRERAGLGWNIFMLILMILALAFIFRGDPEDLLKVGVYRGDAVPAAAASPFLATRHVTFIPMLDRTNAILKVERHQLDLLLDLSGAPDYWVNLHSPRGYVAERVLLGAYAAPPRGQAPQRRAVTGQALSYAGWVLPAVRAMNAMFSSLWGVSFLVVRYRKNGVLRWLKATPLSPFEFLRAQVVSRLLVVLGASLIVYLGAALFLSFPMRGSYTALALIFAAGTLCLISLGLIVSARLRTEELADGILNLIILAHAAAVGGLSLHGENQLGRPGPAPGLSRHAHGRCRQAGHDRRGRGGRGAARGRPACHAGTRLARLRAAVSLGMRQVSGDAAVDLYLRVI